MLGGQDKSAEVAFFNAHAAADAYDVFTVEAKNRIIDRFCALTGLAPGAKVIDLGCGSGAFTAVLRERGYNVAGVDIAGDLIAVAKSKFPGMEFVEGDVEDVPFPTASFDGVLLSGIIHHLPAMERCIAEVGRVLKPGGRFMAFDPNRLNPFMYLYRDPSSPFYSSIGVTKNERPLLPWIAARSFEAGGFEVSTDYLGGLSYRYVASRAARQILPIYNTIDKIISAPPAFKTIRPFVLTYGQKRSAIHLAEAAE
jgi:ubiquinone/menaquinone biosynthesis C-methylase UbiE